MRSKGREKNLKKRSLLAFIIILLLLVVALVGTYFYFHPEEKDKLLEQIPNIITPTPTPTPKITIVDPDSHTRPYAVMIDNNVGNHNHAGLLDAYLTYEIIVEGGLTRIMAIFKDTDTSLIGPVRSSRHYFLDYALENEAIYSHYGWSTFAQNDIRVLGVNNINGMTNGGNAFWRDRSIASPHNVFTSMDHLKKQAESLGYSLTGSGDLLLHYSVDDVDYHEIADAVSATSVSMSYSYGETRSYTYDATTKMYLRSMNGSPHVDKETKEQLSYRNVIIELVSNYTLDREGHQDIRNIRSGDGFLLSSGKLIPITWSKESRSAKTKYTYSNGEEMVVNDGRTFIQIVPINQKVTYE